MVPTTTIPVVDIHMDNFVEFWPAITLGIKSSTFIAIDLEMSGIGNRKDTMVRDTQQRYKAFCDIAKTRSVLALGISIFKKIDKVSDLPECEKDNVEFMVQTFNIMVLSENSFVVEPNSLKFLVEHDFDFNKHYAKGISYEQNMKKEKSTESAYTIRNLFSEILKSSKPIVLHNGILDLVFLYENFYAHLPSTLLMFMADLSEMFTAGIFDTKYIAEYHTDYTASFLNYAFKKSWRSNTNEGFRKRRIFIKCPEYPATVDVHYNNVDETAPNHSVAPCMQYAQYGHCPNGMKCEMSHNIDIILDMEDQKKKKKKRRKRKRNGGITQNNNDIQDSEMAAPSNTEENGSMPITEESETHHGTIPMKAKNVSCGNHRAGFDAFMTGFIMADLLTRFEKSPDLPMAENLSDFVNKLNLSGKDVPLIITKSQYSKTSAAHKEMWNMLMCGAC